MRKSGSHQQEDALARMRDVLQEEYLTLHVDSYTLRESLDEDRCVISAVVTERPTQRTYEIVAEGVGMIDAFFRGMRLRHEGEHPSLASIRFTSFSVRGLHSESAASTLDSEAAAQATIGVRNSYGTEFEFTAVSPSVPRSSIEAVVAAVEYFINSERAYIKTYQSLQYARRSGRSDLVDKYTDLLAAMVRNTSYSQVIERVKGEN